MNENRYEILHKEIRFALRLAEVQAFANGFLDDPAYLAAWDGIAAADAALCARVGGRPWEPRDWRRPLPRFSRFAKHPEGREAALRDCLRQLLHHLAYIGSWPDKRIAYTDEYAAMLRAVLDAMEMAKKDAEAIA